MRNVYIVAWGFLFILWTGFVYAIWFGMNSDLDNVPSLLTQLIPAGHCACQTSTDFNCTTCLDCRPVASTPSLLSPSSGWTYHYGRDSRDLALDQDQCAAAFPGLYEDIHRAVQYWHQSDNITSTMLQDIPLRNGMARAMVFDGDLYVIEVHARGDDHKRKIIATLSSMFRALLTSSHPHSIPDVEFVFSIEDKVEDVVDRRQPIWALARKASEQAVWLMPDFGFWAWENGQNDIGPYSQVVDSILERESENFVWEKKQRKLVWRGKLSFAPKLRRTLLDITRDKPWSDVKELDWSRIDNFLSMEDHCRYMFIAHVEGKLRHILPVRDGKGLPWCPGRSYSASLKYRQACRSVVVVHKLQYIQHYHYLLMSSGPHQNFVEVERDFSDLPAAIEALLADPDKAKRIADNSVETFRERYLTPAAEACYWRALWKGWAAVSPPAELWTTEDKSEKRRRRGMRFESFLSVEDLSTTSKFP